MRPLAFGSTAPKSHFITVLAETVSISHDGSICISLTPSGRISEKLTLDKGYFIDELRYRYSITSFSPICSKLPLIRSFTKIVGARKSASDIGLKEIQKFAKSGKITIAITNKNVGDNKRKASLFSRRAITPSVFFGLPVSILSSQIEQEESFCKMTGRKTPCHTYYLIN